MKTEITKDIQYYKFCLYGFLKNLRFFEPFFMLILLEKGLSFFQIGILYSVREIGIMVLEIPSGLAADSLGRRGTMVVAFSFYLGSFFFFTFTSSYLMLFFPMILFSAADSFRTGTHKAMIFSYLRSRGWGKHAVHYYGHTRSWSQTGSALSALIAAAIVLFSGKYTYIFLFAAIPYFLDLLLMISYPDSVENRKSRGKAMVKTNLKATTQTFFASLRDPRLWKLISNISLFNGYFKALKDYLQPVINGFALVLPILVDLDNKRRTSIMIGLMYSIIYILTAQISRKSGRISKRFGNLLLLLNASLLAGYVMGLLSGLFWILGLPMLSVIVYFLIYLVHNLRKPLGVSVLGESIKGSILATTLSAESWISSLSAAILAPLIGYVADHYSVGLSLVAAGFLMIGFLPIQWMGKGPTPSDNLSNT